MSRYLTRGMVVLADGHPGTSAALATAHDYAPRTVVVAAPGFAPVDGAEVVHPKGGWSIDAAFRCAGQEQIPWITMGRHVADPQQALSQVLEATGRRARKDLPGFAVMFTGAAPRPITRILTVVDRADGQPSGLLVLAAVAAAQATGAQLDVLLLGAPGETVSTPSDVREAVHVTRDKDLYEQAMRRAGESENRANWIAAEDVTDKLSLVLEQIAQGDYDLVIDDLGSINLGGRIGRGGRIQRAVDPAGPARIVRAILEKTDVPVVIVLDGVRLGLVPPVVVKGGAGAVLALGIMAAASPASASEITAQQTSVTQTVDAYDAALTEAAALSSAAEVDAALAPVEEAAANAAGSIEVESSATDTSDGAAEQSDTGADAKDQGGSDEAPADDAPADEASADEGAAESAPEESAHSDVAPAELAPQDVTPKNAPDVAPEDINVDSDVSQKQVDKTQDAHQETKDDLKKAQKDFDTAQDEAIKATEAAQDAAADAEKESEQASEAEAEYQQVATEAAAVITEASGVSKALPGAATSEDAAAAEAEEAAALAEVNDQIADVDQALVDYQDAADAAVQANAELTEAAAAVTEADAANEQAGAKASATESAYEEAMATARVSPVPGYEISTHYGVSGPMWSTGHHTGTDFAAPEGAEVVAAASGTVVEVTSDASYGNRVVIEHEDGYYTTYNHLSQVDVSVGQEVTAGDHIGEVGNTGNSSGAHLHFEVTQGGDGWSSGSFEDPEAWLADA